MAASDSKPIPLKNTAFRAYFGIYDADGDLVASAANLDSEVSIDGGDFADCTSEATQIQTSGLYYLDLTAAEMNGDCIVVQVKTSTEGAKTTAIVIYPASDGDIRADTVMISGDATAADNLELAADGTGYNLGGGAVVAASVTAKTGYSLSAAGVTAVQSGLSTLTAQQVWEYATRTLTSFGTLIADIWGYITRSLTDKTGYGLANGAITAAVIATDAIDADAIAANAVTEIQAGLSTFDPATDVVAHVTLVDTTTTNTDMVDVSALATSLEIAALPTAAENADAVWDEATAGHAAAGSTGKALTDAGAAGDPWSAPVRTLTQSAAQIAAVLEGSTLVIRRGDTFSASLTDLGSLAGYVSLDFTVKTYRDDTDAQAVIRIRKNASGVDDGLLTINRAAGTAAQGSITIDDEATGDITITLDEAATALLSVATGLFYDIQMIAAAGVTTLTEADCNVTADVTRAVA